MCIRIFDQIYDDRFVMTIILIWLFTVGHEERKKNHLES